MIFFFSKKRKKMTDFDFFLKPSFVDINEKLEPCSVIKLKLLKYLSLISQIISNNAVSKEMV